MKTQQIMKRVLGGTIIRQNHKTLMFSASDMMSLFPTKNMANWVKSKATVNFIDTIMIREGLDKNSVIWSSGKKRGDNAGTWLHPLLAVDLAMWLDVNFKYDVLVWVTDHLCINRDSAGNTYKEMCKSVKTSYGNNCSPRVYMDECNMVQGLSGVKASKRNLATSEQLDILTKLERWNARLLDSGVKDIMERKVKIIDFMVMDGI